MAKGKILVMDDEDMVRTVAGKMLEFLGYRAVLSSEGGEAVSLYKKHSEAGEPFDAVILDLVVPEGLDGAGTLAQLLAYDPSAKGIISSGYGENIPASSEIRGQVATIGKPYELKVLGEVLEKVMSASHA